MHANINENKALGKCKTLWGEDEDLYIIIISEDYDSFDKMSRPWQEFNNYDDS